MLKHTSFSRSAFDLAVSKCSDVIAEAVGGPVSFACKGRLESRLCCAVFEPSHILVLCRYAACDLSTEAFRVTAPLQYCYIILSLVDEDSFQLVDLVAGRVVLNSTVPYQCVEKLPVLRCLHLGCLVRTA